MFAGVPAFFLPVLWLPIGCGTCAGRDSAAGALPGRPGQLPLQLGTDAVVMITHGPFMCAVVVAHSPSAQQEPAERSADSA
jgi:hypothetical protein